MNNKTIPFIFSNQIHYISSENNALIVTKKDGSICLYANIETIADKDDPLSQLALDIYHTLF